jgi:hypothetical protein
MNIYANPLKDLETGKVDSFTFLLTHSGVVGTGYILSVCCNHRVSSLNVGDILAEIIIAPKILDVN